MIAKVVKQGRSYTVSVTQDSQTFYLNYRSKDKDRCDFYCEMFNKMILIDLTKNINMDIQKYETGQELIKAFVECESCKSRMSSILDIPTSLSFREYNDIGNTTVLHIYNKNR